MVGAGIVGTWHALELLDAGFGVEHLEADQAAVGASVRNFGLVWVSGRRSGTELDVARRARAGKRSAPMSRTSASDPTGR